ncbi:MAG: RNA methyltransferase [Candidatus Viridilinea halotolerans]|uniref:RNA methyltransferase n=1 Tax=Candidatus Viridilinea halotolerans TaxID=2491704 RepID=A0A426TZA2_9CHLR|nr:MAG: RNA methyltransferase [Candidatus Viridilinea halotolerans]
MITSTTNPHVKHLRSLRDSAKERRSERSLLLEGVRLVAHALAAGARPRVLLYAADQLGATPAGAALLAQIAALPACWPASPQVVAAAAATREPQGVVAAFAWPALPPQPGMRLVLDGIQDPGNLGTLLRSAEAAGVGLAICAPGCADPYNPKVVRAAMGAHFTLPLRVDATWALLQEELSACPLVYMADADATQPYYTAAWPQAAALIIGSEAHGPSPQALALATHTLAIPMHGRAESLNAAVAGSILLFEALRQRA